MQINLRRGSISLDGVELKTRSKGLLHFIGLLAWRFRRNSSSPWVGMQEMGRLIGSHHPRQFQRYVEALEDARLPVVEYKAKTRGPWRLSANIEGVTFDLRDSELDKLFPLYQEVVKTTPPESEPLFNIVRNLADVDRAFQNGQLSDSIRIARSASGNQCDLQEDIELQVLLQLRIAKICTRTTMHDEALAALEVALQILKHHAVLYQELNFKILLSKAKIFYDKGCFSQAFAIVDNLPIHECRDRQILAQYHNLAGLFIHRRLRIDNDAGRIIGAQMGKEWVYSGVAHFRRALISYSFLNDFDGIQAVCFNLGNLFVFAHRLQLLPPKNKPFEQAIRWIALSEQISNKQGVGGDSVWALLALTDIAVSNQIPLAQLQDMTDSLLYRFRDYSAIGDWIHDEARRIGNLLEIAESHHLLAKIAAQSGNSSEASKQAIRSMDLLNELGRNDLVALVKKNFAEFTPTEEGI